VAVTAIPSVSRSVVHVVPQLRLGAGRYVVDTALEQVRSGFRVFVAVGTDAEGEWQSDVRLIRELSDGGATVLKGGDVFHRSVATLLESARTIRALLPTSAGAGVAHAHTAMAAAAARWAGIETVVVTCHGWNVERDRAFDLQDALAFGLVDAVTSPSAYWANALKRDMGIGEVSVIPVGLDLRRYPPPAHAGLGKGPFRIATLAELTERKGIVDLLDAMPAVWSQAPDVELHLFGDGDARQALEARAGTLDPRANRVVFHGFVTDPYVRIQGFDLFCLPSRSDNFPVALMEAMLAGLPVVATEVGGIPELVTGSGCGAIVSARSPEALASAIVAILKTPSEHRTALGARGERFVRQRCAIEVTAGALGRLYLKAAARRRSANNGGPDLCA
jgi:glycosyltransferase involved in cell wall biosynthesis